MQVSILYRGPLSSCNYGCPYCPFAKHVESREEHDADEAALQKFTQFVSASKNINFSIFFTPWGEALIHPRYQKAFVELSNASNVVKLAIQTNLSCKLDWLEQCDRTKVGIWATFHPGEVEEEKFLIQCEKLNKMEVRHSVGIVGLKENFPAIQSMRKKLQASTYLWINAYKREENYYSESEISELGAIDPHFHWNNQYHRSEGKICKAGEDLISVDGSGNIRRCHFIDQVLGNIYADDWTNLLVERPCTNKTCGCHIGYIYLNELQMQKIYGDGMLERIPAQWPNSDYFPANIFRSSTSST